MPKTLNTYDEAKPKVKRASFQIFSFRFLQLDMMPFGRESWSSHEQVIMWSNIINDVIEKTFIKASEIYEEVYFRKFKGNT